MKPELLTPEGVLAPEMLSGFFTLVGAKVEPAAMEPWTDLEMVLAYDWAAREHLSASDNPVQRRPKPAFVEAAEKKAAEQPGTLGKGSHVHQVVREIIAEQGVAGISPNQVISVLAAREVYPSREIVHRWLAADERDGLIVLAGSSRWRATERLESLLYLSKQFPPEAADAQPAPIIPDRPHEIVLTGAQAAQLRAFLKRPNGSWSSGRLTVEAAGHGGVMIRTSPYRVDERLCERAMEALRTAGLVGLSPARLQMMLDEPGLGSVMVTLRALMAAGEVENHSFGMWRVTGPRPPRTRAHEEGML